MICLWNVLVKQMSNETLPKTLLCRDSELLGKIGSDLSARSIPFVYLDDLLVHLVGRHDWDSTKVTAWARAPKGTNSIWREVERRQASVVLTTFRFGPCIHLESIKASVHCRDTPGVMYIDPTSLGKPITNSFH